MDTDEGSISEPILVNVSRELLQAGGVAEAIASTFCEKLTESLIGIIEQLSEAGVHEGQISCLAKSLNIDLDEVMKRTDTVTGSCVGTKRSKRLCLDHAYSVNTPRTVKHCLDIALDALDSTHKRLKVSQQATRCLKVRLDTLQELADSVKEQELLSESACSALLASFTPSASSLIMRTLNSSSGSASTAYPQNCDLLHYLCSSTLARPMTLFVKRSTTVCPIPQPLPTGISPLMATLVSMTKYLSHCVEWFRDEVERKFCVP